MKVRELEKNQRNHLCVYIVRRVAGVDCTIFYMEWSEKGENSIKNFEALR